jgi:hypothetical protein
MPLSGQQQCVLLCVGVGLATYVLMTRNGESYHKKKRRRRKRKKGRYYRSMGMQRRQGDRSDALKQFKKFKF